MSYAMKCNMCCWLAPCQWVLYSFRKSLTKFIRHAKKIKWWPSREYSPWSEYEFCIHLYFAQSLFADALLMAKTKTALRDFTLAYINKQYFYWIILMKTPVVLGYIIINYATRQYDSSKKHAVNPETWQKGLNVRCYRNWLTPGSPRNQQNARQYGGKISFIS